MRCSSCSGRKFILYNAKPNFQRLCKILRIWIQHNIDSIGNSRRYCCRLNNFYGNKKTISENKEKKITRKNYLIYNFIKQYRNANKYVFLYHPQLYKICILYNWVYISVGASLRPSYHARRICTAIRSIFEVTKECNQFCFLCVYGIDTIP